MTAYTRNQIFVVTNQNGIEMTVVAYDESECRYLVERSGHSVVTVKRIGNAHRSTATGVICS